MQFRVEPISDAWHIRAYPNALHVSKGDHRDTGAPYLWHALIIAVGNGECFAYGLDDKISQPQFLGLCDELRRLRFTGVGWHQGGVVRRQAL
ncbi:MAG: hypothetical protein PHT88_04915 [Candidatus Moranbacteria bacterium]|nr:hypothetical protein [Candidatus Moranbacteria bacterium]